MFPKGAIKEVVGVLSEARTRISQARTMLSHITPLAVRADVKEILLQADLQLRREYENLTKLYNIITPEAFRDE